ncbi:hypothetical protein D3C81_1788850 [compost metagenome]
MAGQEVRLLRAHFFLRAFLGQHGFTVAGLLAREPAGETGPDPAGREAGAQRAGGPGSRPGRLAGPFGAAAAARGQAPPA